jgi:hypothetical protein
VRRERALELDVRFSGVLASGTTQIQDRIESGDVVLVGKEQVRTPMSGKDLAIAAGVIYDKRERACASVPTEAVMTTDETEEYLWNLAASMRARGRELAKGRVGGENFDVEI